MAKAFKKAKKKFLSHFYIFWGKINFLQISVLNIFFLFLISLHQILKKTNEKIPRNIGSDESTDRRRDLRLKPGLKN